MLHEPKKIVAALLAVLFLAGSLARCSQAEEPDFIFLCIGQSNMAGRAPMLEEDAAEMKGVLLLNGIGKWEAAKHPLNRYATDRKQINMQRFGLSGPFAEAIRKAKPDKSIGLIVNARGGSNIDEWQRGKPLYDHTIKRVADAKVAKFAGIVWLQGYSNAKDTEYLAKLQTLIASLREDLKQADLPVVIGQAPIYEKNSPVNMQILKAPEVIAHSAVATNENTKKFDAYHYDRNGYMTMGQRLAAAYLKLIADK